MRSGFALADAARQVLGDAVTRAAATSWLRRMASVMGRPLVAIARVLGRRRPSASSPAPAPPTPLSNSCTAKAGCAFGLLTIDGTYLSFREACKAGLVRFPGAPACTPTRRWTVHGGNDFAAFAERSIKQATLGDPSSREGSAQRGSGASPSGVTH